MGSRHDVESHREVEQPVITMINTFEVSADKQAELVLNDATVPVMGLVSWASASDC